MSHCTLCEQPVTTKNKAIFNCGHVFHLSCVLKSPYSSVCYTCNPPTHLLPDFGIDRSIAMTADLHSKIEQRRLKDSKPLGFIDNISRMITPLTPQASTATSSGRTINP